MINKQNSETLAFWLVAQLSQNANLLPVFSEPSKQAEYLADLLVALSEQIREKQLTPHLDYLLRSQGK
ncbi:hypothetical protein [Rodentibacter genomosp. 1]|uniref:hypothetical protein n=1 Tax=Rodentibacter genomosp. 1 TaxID=1908264 RepID=UPI001179A33F|nr:hypothetical protein [Rodentibacter genomosp. 1]